MNNRRSPTFASALASALIVAPAAAFAVPPLHRRTVAPLDLGDTTTWTPLPRGLRGGGRLERRMRAGPLSWFWRKVEVCQIVSGNVRGTPRRPGNSPPGRNGVRLASRSGRTARPVSRSNRLLRNPRRVDRLWTAKSARGPDPKARPGLPADLSSPASGRTANEGRSAGSQVGQVDFLDRITRSSAVSGPRSFGRSRRSAR